jgi:hypothetical protein
VSNKPTPDLRIGDRVNITLQGVEVTQIHSEDPEDAPEVTVYLECAIGGCPVSIPHHWPMVTVEHVAPTEWPPRVGDLWRDRDGDMWLCRRLDTRDGTQLNLVCSVVISGKAGLFASGLPFERVLERHAPLYLVHREEASS